MTGREKLAMMTDEQMAKTMSNACGCCIYRNNAGTCADHACWEGTALWLGNEVSDDDDD